MKNYQIFLKYIYKNFGSWYYLFLSMWLVNLFMMAIPVLLGCSKASNVF